VINSSTNKGVRRLYNANSKNRGGLRGLRGREGGRAGLGKGRWEATGRCDGQEIQYGRVRLLQVCLTPPRAGSPRAHPPYPSTSHPPRQLRAHRSRFNLHTTDHVFRLAFTSSSPYLATIDQAPIVFASTHPHLATGIGRLRAGGCSLVTTPHVRLLCAHTDFVWSFSSRESR